MGDGSSSMENGDPAQAREIALSEGLGQPVKSACSKNKKEGSNIECSALLPSVKQWKNHMKNNNTKNTKYFGRIYRGDLDGLKEHAKSAILIFLYLKIRAGASSQFYLSQMEISKEIGISYSTVQKGLYRLRETGMIEIEQRGRKLSNIYRFPKSDTHPTVSITPPCDTHPTVSITPPCDTHSTVSIHKLEDEEKDNNYIIRRISSLWNWGIDESRYSEICRKYPQCNHDVELLIVDGWLRKKGRTWSPAYALKGLESWFSNVSRSRNRIPAQYRPHVHPSLLSQPREQSQQQEQPQPQEEPIIKASHPSHQKELDGASPALRSIISSLEIAKGEHFTSYRLLQRHPGLQVSPEDGAYIMERRQYEGFSILAHLFHLERDVDLESACNIISNWRG